MAAIVATAAVASIAMAGAPVPADNYVSDVTLVTAISANNSVSEKAADAYCPAGKRAIGGGADLVSGTSGASPSMITSVSFRRNAPVNGPPATDPTGPTAPAMGWRASAAETSAYANTWRVKAFANCAKVDSAAPGTEAGTGDPLEEPPPPAPE